MNNSPNLIKVAVVGALGKMPVILRFQIPPRNKTLKTQEVGLEIMEYEFIL